MELCYSISWTQSEILNLQQEHCCHQLNAMNVTVVIVCTGSIECGKGSGGKWSSGTGHQYG